MVRPGRPPSSWLPETRSPAASSSVDGFYILLRRASVIGLQVVDWVTSSLHGTVFASPFTALRIVRISFT
jgi:hypothetical protein